MDTPDKPDIREAAGCLGSLPNRAGMTAISACLVTEQIAKGGAVVVVDKGQSFALPVLVDQSEAEQVQRVMRVGRKRNDGLVVEPKNAPYYRQFDKRKF